MSKDCNCGLPLHELTITTHWPNKWRFVDMETGDVWRQSEGSMIRADDVHAMTEKLEKCRR